MKPLLSEIDHVAIAVNDLAVHDHGAEDRLVPGNRGVDIVDRNGDVVDLSQLRRHGAS